MPNILSIALLPSTLTTVPADEYNIDDAIVRT